MSGKVVAGVLGLVCMQNRMTVMAAVAPPLDATRLVFVTCHGKDTNLPSSISIVDVGVPYRVHFQ